MISIYPKELQVKERHQLIIGSVSPRPIALASTIDRIGNANLAPYSFFNAFSSTPPVLIFSSNNTVRDNKVKDTLNNIIDTGEVVINTVSYNMLRQMALTSINYPPEVNEFDKSGLTPIPSKHIKPSRVKESPVQFECKVREVVPLGEEGGAANLIICDVLLIHLDPAVLDENKRIDPHKIDLVSRMGSAYYARASGNAVYEVVQPFSKIGIGFDQLPGSIKNSTFFTGNELGLMASVINLPSVNEVLALKDIDAKVVRILQEENSSIALYEYARENLSLSNTKYALKLAMLVDLI